MKGAQDLLNVFEKGLKRKKAIIFTILVSIVFCNRVFTYYSLHRKVDDTRLINLSGRQSELYLNITLDYTRLVYEKNNDSLVTDLKRTIPFLNKIHYGMILGDSTLKINPLDNEEIRNQLIHLNAYVDLTNKLTSSGVQPSQQMLLQLLAGQEGFSDGMNRVVHAFYKDATAKNNQILYNQVIFTFIILVLLFLSIRFIYYPLERKLNGAIFNLVKNEYKLRALVNSSKEANVFIDPDYKVITFNKKAALDMMEYHKKAIREGDDFIQYIYQDGFCEFTTAFKKALAGEVQKFDVQIPVDEQLVWFHLEFIPVYGETDIIGVSFISDNIDQNVKAAQSNQNYESLLRKIAWKQSHQMRAPVANLLGLFQLLEMHCRKVDDPEAKSLMNLMGEEVRKIDLVIHKIVDRIMNQ